MAVTDKLVFIVPDNRTVGCYMGQIGADIGRADMRGKVFQTHGLMVEVGSRIASNVVILERRN